jgi:hypothetical protein
MDIVVKAGLGLPSNATHTLLHNALGIMEIQFLM